nr:MAG TPA: hypothetical protein [Caudoviricetes sp.]
MERDNLGTIVNVEGRDFNSHAHVERDDLNLQIDDQTGISTHTLTWSVTPAPAQILCRQLHFNSHAHVERDILA